MAKNKNTTYQAAYTSAYKTLNKEQLEAVNTIEGPVMVIAGPGTGKTQILALRIGRILETTDTQAHNILCLTYTDAGAINMRKRLLKFIGPDAYKIHVHTFHSFCNEIIQDHPEFFSAQQKLHHVSDLEKAQLLRKLIDQLPLDNPLRRLKGDIYFEATRLEKLFSLMKREFWSSDFLLQKIDDALHKILNDKNNLSSRGVTKGKLKAAVRGKVERLKLLRAAACTFDTFQTMMRDAGRYDFDDMIHWVVNAFMTQEELLALYQERFLYTLVDEYQDTNGAQNKIIHQLSSFWDRPNLFVVGDPDQAIFRFQGANMHSILDHYARFDPTLVVLKENYRSSQELLDASRTLIDESSTSINEVLSIEAALKAVGPYSGHTGGIRILEYTNGLQEEVGTIHAIEALLERGTSASEIAVIYRKHSQAVNLIKVLTQREISVNVKQRTDILNEPLISNLYNILRYIQAQVEDPGSEDQLLFEILHYRFFDIDPLDLAKVAAAIWKPGQARKPLRFSITERDLLESLNLNDASKFLDFSSLIDRWVQDVPHVSVQVLLERILKSGNIFREVMTSERRTYEMQLLATFFNHLKAECRRQPGLTLATFLHALHEMHSIGLQLQMQNLIRSREGVQFLTAHGAKGLEFEHVFLIGCSSVNWKNQPARWNQYSLPDSVTDPSTDSDLDDERRLFYVAMTRAKHSLTVSYPAQSAVDMPVEPNRFLAETGVSEITQKMVLESDMIDYYSSLLVSDQKKLPLLDHDLIDRVLDRLQLSSTALNNYLACPRTFYFQNILRVPLANSPHLGYGNAVHNALQSLINAYNGGVPFSEGALLEYFQEEMERAAFHFSSEEFKTYSENGRLNLPVYLELMQKHWESCSKLEAEKPMATTEHMGVPIRGRIDLIEHLPNGRYRIVDFKTGKFDRQKVKTPEKLSELGGNYWRQMVFYKILLRESDLKIPMDEGCMSFIEPNPRGVREQVPFLIDFGQEALVSQQIQETWRKIQNHEFDVDCGQDYCTWCSFVRNEYVLSSPERLDAEDEAERHLATEEPANDVSEPGQLAFHF